MGVTQGMVVTSVRRSSGWPSMMAGSWRQLVLGLRKGRETAVWRGIHLTPVVRMCGLESAGETRVQRAGGGDLPRQRVRTWGAC